MQPQYSKCPVIRGVKGPLANSYKQYLTAQAAGVLRPLPTLLTTINLWIPVLLCLPVSLLILALHLAFKLLAGRDNHLVPCFLQHLAQWSCGLYLQLLHTSRNQLIMIYTGQCSVKKVTFYLHDALEFQVEI